MLICLTYAEAQAFKRDLTIIVANDEAIQLE